MRSGRAVIGVRLKKKGKRRMKTAIKLALLSVMTALAVIFAVSAVATLERTVDPIPIEVYASYRAKSGRAEYFLRDEDGRVAVFRSGKNTPESVTEIETALLRRADRAMLGKGIPAEDRGELLSLLEDLGS